jgi:hypothetical protein
VEQDRSGATSVSTTSPDDSPDDSQDPPEATLPTHPRTRSGAGIRKPKVYTDGTVRYGFYTSTSEPQSLEEALGNSNWCNAMDIEYDALMKNKTWHLVPPCKGRNETDCKWV